MKCPRCGARSRCYDSRPQEDGTVLRRRQCKAIACLYKFQTTERVRVAAGHYVPLKDQGRVVRRLERSSRFASAATSGPGRQASTVSRSPATP